MPEGQLSPFADSMSSSQSAISQWGWGFHTVRSAIDPWELISVPGLLELYIYIYAWRSFCSGDGTLSSKGAAGPRRWPEGQFSPRPDSMSSSQPAISQWGWGLHTVLGDMDSWELSFIPGLLKFQIYGKISYPGMGRCPPRVRRDLDVGQRGNSRRALAP